MVQIVLIETNAVLESALCTRIIVIYLGLNF